MEDGNSGRDRARIAGDQADEDGCRRDESELRRASRQNDGENGEQGRRDDKADPGARAFPEVIGDERAMDPGADSAGEDHDVGAQFGEGHWLIQLPWGIAPPRRSAVSHWCRLERRSYVRRDGIATTKRELTLA